MNRFEAQLLIRDRPLIELAAEQGWRNQKKGTTKPPVPTRRRVSIEEFEASIRPEESAR